jgi:hypothetical protein
VTVVGCTGHQNLSPDTASTVAAAIATELARLPGPLTGVCSLAAGSDQIFAEVVLSARGQLRAIIPCHGYASTFAPVDRVAYETLLSAATSTTTLPHPEPSEQAYMEAGHEVVKSCELLIAVWDGAPAAGLGGTADVVRYAREKGCAVSVIWPTGASRG